MQKAPVIDSITGAFCLDILCLPKQASGHQRQLTQTARSSAGTPVFALM
jgi:hypothetical protein